MKIDDAVETIAHFFNDLIGTLIPGIVLVVGLLVIHFGIPEEPQEILEYSDGFFVFILLTLLFAIGHTVLGLHSVLRSLIRMLRKRILVKYPNLKKFLPEGLFKKHDEKQSYLLFEKILSGKIRDMFPGQTNAQESLAWDFHDLRNLALSTTAESASLGRRFMFISLLCNGVATATLILLLDYVVCVTIAPHLIIQYEYALPVVVQVILLISVAGLLFKRGEEFYSRAMSAPFPVALSEFINNRRTDAA